LGVKRCASMEGRRHRRTAQQGARILKNGQSDKQHHTQDQLYKIPDELCLSVAMHVNTDIANGGGA
jgi:hypothetical protein